MFKDTEQGETQYCQECFEKQNKIDLLEQKLKMLNDIDNQKMDFFEWIIQHTSAYKKLYGLYCQAEYDRKMNDANVEYYKEQYKSEHDYVLSLQKAHEKMEKTSKNYIDDITKLHEKHLTKILELVNKLEQNNEYVREIRFMIEEILSC